MPVLALRMALGETFRNIIPETVARKCKREMNKVVQGSFQDFRMKHLEATNQFLEEIADMMETEPFHRLQTKVRKAPIELQLLLLERVVTVDGWLSEKDPFTEIDVPESFHELFSQVFIRDYSEKVEQHIE